MLTLATSRQTPASKGAVHDDPVTRLWRTDPVLAGTGLFLAALAVPFGLGLLLDPRDHHRRPGLAQAGEVRRLDRDLHVHAGVGLHLPAGLAADAAHRRHRHGRRARPGGGAHRRPGVARHHQPLQHRDAVRRGRLRRHGPGHRRADAARRRAGRGALAPAVRRSRAGLGAAPRHRRDRARRVHRRADDAADGGAARGGPRDAPDADLGRPHRRRARRRARAAR